MHNKNKFKQYLPLIALGITLVFCLTQQSQAAMNEAVVGVSASVIGVCLTVTALPLAFGSYDPTSSSSLDQQTTVAVTCVSLTPYTIALNAGTTVGGTLSQRLMVNSDYTLKYNLFTDSNRTQIWGDGSGSTRTVSSTGIGVVQNFIIYGRVPSGQRNVQAGTYTDTITVTVTY